jgi:hypothetical protein
MRQTINHMRLGTAISHPPFETLDLIPKSLSTNRDGTVPVRVHTAGRYRQGVTKKPAGTLTDCGPVITLVRLA